jgi:L-fucono-1,5-lactonase
VIVDAHLHFWRIDRGDYSWMDDSVAPIRRDVLPPEFDEIRARLSISGSIVVQAAPTLAETEFLLGLADSNPSILGVVGWVDLGRPQAVADVRRLARHPRFKGIRPMLQDIEETEWILRPENMTTLRAVCVEGLRMDALVTPRHLPVIEILARKLPDLPMAIDHCGKPAIAGGNLPDQAWKDGMRRLSDFPQIYCKLSGLATEFGTGWSANALAPVFQYVFDCFGSDRVLWGSDWPVLELVGRYDDWFRAVRTFSHGLSAGAEKNLWGGTAAAFYGLDET